MKSYKINGYPVSIADLTLSWMEKQSREELKQRRKARSDRYGIAVQENSSLTIPSRFEGATEADFADPVNYKYPVWLTKTPENITEDQLGQVRNAPVRFSQFGDEYDTKSRSVVAERIERALKKFKIGEYAKKSETMHIFAKNEDKQIVYGIPLWPGLADSQGDIVEIEDIEQAAHNWLAKSRMADWQHKELLPSAVPVESYIAPVDFSIGDYDIKKGSWIVGMHITDPKYWQKIKAGDAMGFSITGKGKRMELG